MLRAAYTTNGVNFTDLGPISGPVLGSRQQHRRLQRPLQPQPAVQPGQQRQPDDRHADADRADQPLARAAPTRSSCATSARAGRSSPTPTAASACSCRGLGRATATATRSTRSSTRPRPTAARLVATDGRAEHRLHVRRLVGQDTALRTAWTTRSAISAYYSGRAYGPAIVQNPNGTLTMVFSGYRLPKPITAAGTAARHGLPIHDRGQRPCAVPQHPHHAAHLGHVAGGWHDNRGQPL